MAKFSDKDVSLALMGRTGFKEYPFPGVPGATCAVRALTEEQLDTVRTEAVAFCKTKQVDLAWDPEFLDRAIRRCTILHAVLDPKTGNRFFDQHADVARLDAHVVRTLFELYLAHVSAIDPLANCSAEEVNELVEALGKGGMNPAVLSLYARDTVQLFAISMASILRAQQPTSK